MVGPVLVRDDVHAGLLLKAVGEAEVLGQGLEHVDVAAGGLAPAGVPLGVDDVRRVAVVRDGQVLAQEASTLQHGEGHHGRSAKRLAQDGRRAC